MSAARRTTGHIFRRESGSWAFSTEYRDASGQRRQTTRSGFRTRKDAEAAARALRVSIDQGRLPFTATAVTLTEWCATWLTGLEGGRLRPTTVAHHRRIVSAYIAPRLGDRRLADIKTPTIVAWLASLREDNYSPATVRHAWVTLHKALKAAVAQGLLEAVPVLDEDSRPATPTGRAGTLGPSRAQLASVLNALDASEYRVALTLALRVGLRRAEVAALRWSAVDLDHGALRVVRTRVVAGGGRVVESEPKTDKSRRGVSIDADVVALLREHRLAQAELRLAHGLGPIADAYVMSAHGEPEHPDRLTDAAKALGETAGVPLTFHPLRHLHGTAMLQAGVPLKVVSERLGHSSIAITGDTYQHVSSELDRQAAERTADYWASLRKPEPKPRRKAR